MDCTKQNHENRRKNNKQRTVSQYGEQHKKHNKVAIITITTQQQQL